MLEKTTRMNLLYDFYGVLLTDKQRTFMEMYYSDDLSLAEIAEQYNVSRQAVHDNIRRSETQLEEYEAKLLLLERYESRLRLCEELASKMNALLPPGREREETIRLLRLLAADGDGDGDGANHPGETQAERR